MKTWLIVAGVYLVMSAVTALAYKIDKRRAVKGKQRIRERTLHLLEFFGGWPGGLAARRVFRHKSIDLKFRLISWLIVIVHALVWAGYFYLRSRGIQP